MIRHRMGRGWCNPLPHPVCAVRPAGAGGHLFRPFTCASAGMRPDITAALHPGADNIQEAVIRLRAGASFAFTYAPTERRFVDGGGSTSAIIVGEIGCRSYSRLGLPLYFWLRDSTFALFASRRGLQRGGGPRLGYSPGDEVLARISCGGGAARGLDPAHFVYGLDGQPFLPERDTTYLAGLSGLAPGAQPANEAAEQRQPLTSSARLLRSGPELRPTQDSALVRAGARRTGKDGG